MTANMGIYRAADNDFIDMTKTSTTDWLSKNYPAIMADRPVGMSDEYQFMPSHRIAVGLQTHFGLQLSQVSQQWSRARDPRGQEHVMRFRFPGDSDVKLREVGDAIPELVIFNSHNGRSAIKAFGGVFRLVCSNGMVVADKSFGEVKMRHFGANNTFKAFGEVLDQFARRMSILDQRIRRMEEIVLSPHHQNTLARAMMKVRKTPTWVDPADVLKAQRPEDERADNGTRTLWCTFNVLQENLTKREISNSPGEGERRRSIRALSGARADLMVNEALWLTLDEFIEAHFPTAVGEVIDVDPIVQHAVAALPAPVEEAVVVEAPKAKRVRKAKVTA